MEITAAVLFTILIGHALFDWVFQTRWMAETKCHLRSGFWMHIGVYAIGLLAMSQIAGLSLIWAGFNAFAHATVDGVTSQITSYAWINERKKLFWNTVGIDQLVHYVCLFGSIFLGL